MSATCLKRKSGRCKRVRHLLARCPYWLTCVKRQVTQISGRLDKQCRAACSALNGILCVLIALSIWGLHWCLGAINPLYMTAPGPYKEVLIAEMCL